MVLKPLHRGTLAEQTEGFYAKQAAVYDQFRHKILHGREDLYRQVAEGWHGIWVDIGAGTGWCFERIAEKVPQFDHIYLVDSSPSLLAIAHERIARMGWKNVEPVLADGMTFMPTEGPADLVTFSYSLTMMHDWMGALWHAREMLRPGGRIGVVDFYVSRKFPIVGCTRHSRFTRFYFPFWFDGGNIFFSPDMLRFLDLHFKTGSLFEGRGKLPYTLFSKVPYFVLIGEK